MWFPGGGASAPCQTTEARRRARRYTKWDSLTSYSAARVTRGDGRRSAGSPPDCPHAAVTPRWDSGEDMGKTELVSAYVCEACGARFSREEGETLGASAADRLRVREDERQEGMRR